MQKQQVFKVKGMQRDASMANANGEFAYEILNMRLMPAEDLSGFSLTNEKGTTKVITSIKGQVIGQCPTNDSLVVFTTDIVDNEDGTQSKTDYIYEIYQTPEGSWTRDLLYTGDLNFHVDKHIEALFNYETEDIQKVYWIDEINQLRCINLVGEIQEGNNQQFDSVKEINSLPSVEIERVAGGSFTAGVLQYYITYFNKNSSESPIVYTSPLLYIAHDNRGANVNDQVSTAFKLTFTDLDTDNWEYMRIYVTHRTSIDATPEASIVTELNMNNSTIEFTDYGSNRTSIASTDLYFTGGKFVKAGTMTIKDQVMFLGNLNIETPETVSVTEIQQLFESIRGNTDHPFTTTTRKTKENKLEEYEGTHYYYKNQLNNTESITHYKYGEKYRFGISVLDKYGNWSNPIWVKDAFIEVPPEQVDSNTLKLPCPSLDLSYSLMYDGETKTLLEHLQDRGAIDIKPIVVFPKEDERKVIAQGVVCPTVYNLKDRKENGPYAQASWFMRPNAPVDLWGFSAEYLGKDLIDTNVNIAESLDGSNSFTKNLYHKSDIYDFSGSDIDSSMGHNLAGYYGISDNSYKLSNHLSPIDIIQDDFSAYPDSTSDSSVPRSIGIKYSYSAFGLFTLPKMITDKIQHVKDYKVLQRGTWLEFRHNYALRTPGWSFGTITPIKPWSDPVVESVDWGMVRGAELDVANFNFTAPTNRFDIDSGTKEIKLGERDLNTLSTGNSAYYVDNSIVTLNSPEIELSRSVDSSSLSDTDFRIIGMIPLTATSSDMTVEVSNPATNPTNLDVGLTKIFLNNLNYNIHGFKGISSSNAYYSHNDRQYAMVPLSPWHSTGSLGYYHSTDDNSGIKSLLKRKILSNLRYSASTYFFHPNTLHFYDTNLGNQANLGTKVIGWKPANKSQIIAFNKESSEQIEKLQLDYPNIDSMVYKGNIDTIATLSSGKNANNALDSRIYALGVTTGTPNLDPSVLLYEPALSSYADKKKVGKGASIKYKSSPHFVVGFKPFNGLWGTNQIVQETLPAWKYLNEEGLLSQWSAETSTSDLQIYKRLYESEKISSLYHQNYLEIYNFTNLAGLENGVVTVTNTGMNKVITNIQTTSDSKMVYTYNEDSDLGDYDSGQNGIRECTFKNLANGIVECFLTGYTGINNPNQSYMDQLLIRFSPYGQQAISRILSTGSTTPIVLRNTETYALYSAAYTYTNLDDNDLNSSSLGLTINNIQIESDTSILCDMTISFDAADVYLGYINNVTINDIQLTIESGEISEMPSIKLPGYGWLWLGEIYREADPIFGGTSDWALQNNQWENAGNVVPLSTDTEKLEWTQGDTYYQRFDTLKTYAYSDSDQNSVIDITSFMVETRINIDGRTDRNRGQESNLQMSPTNFNLMNDVYSQRDNFFTYRILDEDLQARTNFPNQITWSLTKTAGATVDAWMNITLASVLDLDGTKGKISALKNFNNNIIAFQEKGLSHIMFNSRAQIATSESVPIQIANTGKVDGQQYFTTDVGCQDKWNIVTTPNGLYFVDYFNKSIYRFKGQLEDISTSNGFRSWCYENLSPTANILGYYDVKNKEVMYYIGDTRFKLDNGLKPTWLGFSELTGAFSSFYTYPKAWFANVQDQGLWLLSGNTGTTVFTHQTGDYNQLLNTSEPFYGLTVIPRQDSNLVKTFNNVEFRADSYNSGILDNNHTFNTIAAETEYQTRTTNTLTYSQYRPSNLKKKFRTWRANIPRVNNGYNRFVNQWAKIGLWKTNPSTEKTILHDLSVWYSE